MAVGRAGGRVGSRSLSAVSAGRRGVLKVVASCASSGRSREGVLEVLPWLGGGCAWKLAMRRRTVWT